MSNEKDKNGGEDFALGWSPESLSTVNANQGLGFKRVRPGDYRLKVADIQEQPSKNAKTPHMMYKVVFEVVQAYDDQNEGEVGGTVDNLYGSPSSPKFMQERFKALIEATKLNVKAGLKRSHLIGKELDASIVWELSDSGQYDEMGNKKKYTNARIKAERPVGTSKPKGFDPIRDSRAALKHAEGGDDADTTSAAPSTETAPWEEPRPTNGKQAKAAAIEPEDTDSGFLPEAEALEKNGEAIYEYRARYKLGIDAEEMKSSLVENGVDPDGPIEVSKLEEDTAKRYNERFGTKKKGGLGKLGGKNAQPTA